MSTTGTPQQTPAMSAGVESSPSTTAGPPNQRHVPGSGRQPAYVVSAPGSVRIAQLPDMRMRRLMGVSAWALALGSCGLILGTVAMFRMIAEVPAWFLPSFVGAGVFGLLLVVISFVTVQYQRIPWLLLSASTVTFIIGVILLSQA